MITPLIKFAPQSYTKLEFANPGGSHKYRAAKYILRKAIEDGLLRPGYSTVIEKTGGNFGFGLLAACAEFDISVDLAVGLGFSQTKRDLLESFGATLIGKDLLQDGMTPKEVVAYYLKNQAAFGRHYHYTDQFQNIYGVFAHKEETGHELAAQLKALDSVRKVTFVGCAGTGASFTGIAYALKEAGFDVQAVLVEPEGCNARENIFVDHRFEGMCVGVQPPFLDWDIVDEIRTVTYQDMLATQIEFFRSSGHYVGNTSAACLAIANDIARASYFAERTIVTISYDSGLWYRDIFEKPRTRAAA